MPTASLIAAAIAFVLSLIGTRVAMVLAERLRFRDVPGREAHKQHAAPVPYGGGLAMAVAMAVAITVAANC
jgi:UDP-N-acetylmuramyl pentapeptide phosphotransferase/UDP-N-acetylglucosamine-1-phosphate transferase